MILSSPLALVWWGFRDLPLAVIGGGDSVAEPICEFIAKRGPRCSG